MAPWALALLAVAAWLGALFPGGFAFDDREAIFDNPVVRADVGALTAFTQDYWHHIGDAGHYRPLATLSLRLDYRLYGGWGPGYHLTCVLLHALVVLLAALLLGRLAEGRAERGICMLGLGVFALHPGLADSVAWISARSSTLSVLPGLGAALLLHPWLQGHRRNRALAIYLAMALSLIGLLGKEDGFLGAIFPALVVAHSWRAHRLAPSQPGLRKNQRGLDMLWAALGLAAGLLAYGYLRHYALGSVFPSAPFAPLANAPLSERLYVAGATLTEATRLLLWPLDQVPNYRVQDWASSGLWSVALGWTLWASALAMGVYLGAKALRRANPQLALAGALICAPLGALPVLQIIPAGEIFAGRFLYVPMLLGVPVLGYILHLFGRRIPRIILPLILVGTCVLCWQASQTYTSRRAYQEAVLKRFPSDVFAWNNLGLALEEEGHLGDAVAAWKFAIDLDETYGRPHSNLGRVELERGNGGAALKHFEAAASLGPGNATAWINLGSMHSRLKDFERAQKAYDRATRLAPGISAGWSGLGATLATLGEVTGARAALARALELDPNNTRAKRTLESLP